MEEEDDCSDVLQQSDDIFLRLWHIKYGDITREELSRQLCKGRAIKNDTDVYEKFIQWRKIDLGDNYEVYCRGKINDVYEVTKIRIYSAISNNLSGPHLVSIEDGTPFWVHSLTALRKKFLQFEDFVSFERSAFITFECDTLTPIRIKMLRQNIVIPTEIVPDRVYHDPDRFYYYSPQDIKSEVSGELTQRSKAQINRLLFQVRQIYFRDNVILPDKFN